MPLLSYVPYFIFFLFGGLNGNPAMKAVVTAILTILLPPLMFAPLVLFCRVIRTQLREKGFDWISSRSAGQLYIALGSRVHRIPPHDQLATLPGYKEGDIESIIDLMEGTAPRR